MISRLRRLVPGPVKSVLRPLVHRLRERRRMPKRLDNARSKQNLLREQRDEARQQRDEARQQRDTARGQRDEAYAKRDGARRDLQLALVHQPTEAGGRFHHAWADQRDALKGEAAQGARVLAYYPIVESNPYCRLLYSHCPSRGFDPQPLVSLEHLYRLPSDAVVHLHWTRAAQHGAVSEADARSRTAAFLTPIEDFVSRGGSLLWSVHEVFPHDCEYRVVETELRRRLADLAHGIHVLHESTPKLTDPHYRLDPERTFIVEHPLYTEFYPRYTDRVSARAALGLGDHPTLLAFGLIRPYKRFDRLVRLLPAIKERLGADTRLLIVGSSLKPDYFSGLVELAASQEGATLVEGPVPDEAVHLLFRAVDATVLPYREHLNSGVLMLSLTFATPVVVARNPVTEELGDSGFVHTFDSESDDDLVKAICSAISGTDPAHRGLPPSLSQRFDPSAIADQFADHVARIVGRRDASADQEEDGSSASSAPPLG